MRPTTASEVRIYLNGVLDSGTVPPNAGPIDTSKAGQTGVELELAIGDRMAFYSDPAHFQAGGTRTFKGLIDELALYPTALSSGAGPSPLSVAICGGRVAPVRGQGRLR